MSENRIDRELPPIPDGACEFLFKDTAKYRTAREIWLCTKDELFAELSREKGKRCLEGKWCER